MDLSMAASWPKHALPIALCDITHYGFGSWDIHKLSHGSIERDRSVGLGRLCRPECQKQRRLMYNRRTLHKPCAFEQVIRTLELVLV